jgi:predicted GIY-YIG superfamily endonuclease
MNTGFVYMIRSSKGPLHYIGSTTKSLNERFQVHINSYKSGNNACSVK